MLGIIQDTPLVYWLLAVAFGLAIECTAKRKISLHHLCVNIASGILVLLSGYLIAAPIITGLANIARSLVGVGWIDLRIFSETEFVSEIGAAALYLFIFDFFYYWWHRSQHVYPSLWEQHAVHHSDTEFGVTTFLRQHWTEVIFQAFLIHLPIIIAFRLTPVTFWVISGIIASFSFFTHLNLPIQLGSCAWLITSPQLHRLHHSKLPQHANHNFAAFFPVWDLVFGTYQAPIRDEFPPTGLMSNEKIESLTEVVGWPMRRWIATLTKMNRRLRR
ncbi:MULTISPECIES: sterol desaturase family protein [Bradyrhizobium]|uniref:Sterol desaturase/sphingolipid hydroxylase (Fatty acid hydroxylase superfamily) n=1 Tax=Bradyrhizobium ottawaense TaxID=931866 RepID=A0ABV4FX63_9BRAD|nr:MULTISPECIES: sterol desaturase family protein [Bradyrhizobium]MBR1292601.1 sterol desaturase family protein [Bradyrhizobium ottawaense]MBR1364675.1 sterol desaturase family protein [Bradyrhizobium ottawaense]WLB47803.1 sterol desaturase family protein [Bradyrhizobium ottawaense]WQN85140.1 sterol desaturase family protein [Bradyrhizobium ottawaense]GMO42701.1 hypothetical protein BwSF21_55300 [Bradyrhizobium ottawaense]